MPEKKVVIYNDSIEESSRIRSLLDLNEFDVFETTSVLEAVHIVKAETICMVFASNRMSEDEVTEFRELISSHSPGTRVMFLNPVMNEGGMISLRTSEFSTFLQESIRTEESLTTMLGNFKQFFLAFSDRLLQIFGVTDRYLFNKDHLIAKLSRNTALRMGFTEEMADTIQIAALLKDIGMLGVQHQMIDEEKTLTQSEINTIKKHPSNTLQMLKEIKFPWNVDAIILQHHENYDGTGYSTGLKGRQIAIGARVVHVADAFVAMTTDRPYRKALTQDEAIKEIVRGAGTLYDPEVVEAFQTVVAEDMPPSGQRRSILLIERVPDLAPMVKLSHDPAEFDVMISTNGVDAISKVYERVPDIIVCDVEILQKNTIIHFFNAMYEVPAMQECAFVFVVPDENYPHHFIGDKVRYITRPIEMSRISETIGELLGELPTTVISRDDVKGITGTLEDFSLPDIIQILRLGLKTARVEIIRGSTLGIIHLTSGNITNAVTGHLKGKDAFYEMMGWKTGSFRIQHGITTKENNVNADTLHLLLDAARYQDELSK